MIVSFCLFVCLFLTVCVFLSLSFCLCLSVSVFLSLSFCRCLSVSVFRRCLSVSVFLSMPFYLCLSACVFLSVSSACVFASLSVCWSVFMSQSYRLFFSFGLLSLYTHHTQTVSVFLLPCFCFSSKFCPLSWYLSVSLCLSLSLELCLSFGTTQRGRQTRRYIGWHRQNLTSHLHTWGGAKTSVYIQTCTYAWI